MDHFHAYFDIPLPDDLRERTTLLGRVFPMIDAVQAAVWEVNPDIKVYHEVVPVQPAEPVTVRRTRGPNRTPEQRIAAAEAALAQAEGAPVQPPAAKLSRGHRGAEAA